jgi:hypothetical protein
VLPTIKSAEYQQLDDFNFQDFKEQPENDLISMSIKETNAKAEPVSSKSCEDPVFLEFSQKCQIKEEKNIFSLADLVITQD